MVFDDLAKNPAFGSVEAVERAIRDGTLARKLGHISAPELCDDVDAFAVATEPNQAEIANAQPPACSDESTKALPAHLALD
ncbi:hypothetical protein L6V77_34765 [Myxococcota bacterium]|nr:hypothetical protein [Myxococcota bacterium]